MDTQNWFNDLQKVKVEVPHSLELNWNWFKTEANFSKVVFLCDPKAALLEQSLVDELPGVHVKRWAPGIQTNACHAMAIGNKLKDAPPTIVKTAFGDRVVRSLLGDKEKSFPINGHPYLKSFVLEGKGVRVVGSDDTSLIEKILENNGIYIEDGGSNDEALVVVGSITSIEEMEEVASLGTRTIHAADFTKTVDEVNTFEELLRNVKKPLAGVPFVEKFTPTNIANRREELGFHWAAAEDFALVPATSEAQTADQILELRAEWKKNWIYVEASWIESCDRTGRLVPLEKRPPPSLPPFYKSTSLSGVKLLLDQPDKLPAELSNLVEELRAVPVKSRNELFHGIVGPSFSATPPAHPYIAVRNSICITALKKGPHECSDNIYHGCHNLTPDALSSFSSHKILKVACRNTEISLFADELNGAVNSDRRLEKGRDRKNVLVWDGVKQPDVAAKLLSNGRYESGSIVAVRVDVLDALARGEKVDWSQYVWTQDQVPKTTPSKRKNVPQSELVPKKLRLDSRIEVEYAFRRAFGLFAIQFLTGVAGLNLRIGPSQFELIESGTKPRAENVKALNLIGVASIQVSGTGVIDDFSEEMPNTGDSVTTGGVYYSVDGEHEEWARKLKSEVVKFFALLGLCGLEETENGVQVKNEIFNLGQPVQLFKFTTRSGVKDSNWQDSELTTITYWFPLEGLERALAPNVERSREIRKVLVLCSAEEDICLCKRESQDDGKAVFLHNLDRTTNRDAAMVFMTRSKSSGELLDRRNFTVTRISGRSGKNFYENALKKL